MKNRLLPCGVIGLSLIAISTLLAQPVQSVLQRGPWLKIGVTQAGIYRLDFATLTKANPAFASADPRQFRLYGNGGAPLPQPNAQPRPSDLTENTVQVTGEADGRFDPADAILFFGQAPTTVRYDAAGRQLTHQLNLYTDTTFYFLTAGSSAGQRIANRPVGSITTGTAITSYDEYVFREAELVKPLASGRAWLGDAFQGDLSQSKTFTFTVPGRIASTPVLIQSAVMVSSTAQTTFFLQLNGKEIGSQAVDPVGDVISRYTTKGILNTARFSTTPAGTDEQLTVQMTSARKGGSGSSGYLDFLSLQYRREIRQYSQPSWIRTTAGRFTAKQATAALRIWDISNPLRPAEQAYMRQGNEAVWSSDSLLRHEYYLFTPDQLQTPALLAPIANQNIHGQSIPDLLIVTPEAWRSEAERLAQFRRTNDNLSVLVATTQQVYNEFASGQPDPTAIRDLCRYFYQQKKDGLRYLLLFGDATYDYRNIEALLSPAEQANTVPVYESRESLNPLLSFSSDDYFGFLKNGDGEWTEDFTGDQLLDIGVGRLPVKTVAEARLVVDKLISYSQETALVGDWRTKLLLVADDGDDNIHQKDADNLASFVEAQHPAYKPERLFLDTFSQTTATVGTTVVEYAPTVNQLIRNGINEGRLIVNYTGHGGVTGWAQEQILTVADLLALKNKRLPLLVTATCEFGRYDDPASNSGAEVALLHTTAGAVGLLTTTRPVFADKNLLLNQAFYRNVFRPVAGRMPRLGDIMRATKDSSLSGVQNRNFALLGDPSMQLAYPKAEVAVTQVNGRLLTTRPPDTLHALEPITLTGLLRKPGTTQPDTDFSGTVQLALYDQPVSQTTLGTESSPKLVFSSYTNLLYSSQVPVKNGQFQVQFTLPKDLGTTIRLGRLYTYATADAGLPDASGAIDLVLGGKASVRTPDTSPPVVQLSLADPIASQSVPTAVGPTVTLLIDLSDNEGINLSQTGTSAALTLQLDQQPPVPLGTYFTPTSTDGRQGRVRYKLTDLKGGSYTVRVKAYDLSNNLTQSSLTFNVVDQAPLSIGTVVAYPNPFRDKVTISVDHNRPGETLLWTVTMLDVLGRRLNQQSGQCDACPTPFATISWDGTGGSGAALPSGTYLYQLQIRTADQADGTTSHSSKLLIAR